MSDHISVCVCTYQRPRRLSRLLRNLALQETAGRFTFSTVVVDNDVAGSAQPVVVRERLDSPLEIVYDIEPQRTIPAARNHALRLARGNYIGIIDDDEFPSPRWLLRLHDAVGRFGVDGALGPVYPFFEQPPPAWLIKSGLVNLPNWPTGTPLQWTQTRTGNVLLKKDVFDRHGLVFDETFRTGGSDQAFFRKAMGLGFRFVAVAEAPVYEIVPPERWGRRYFLNRAMVNGFNARKYLVGKGRTKKTVVAVFKSAAALAVYAVSIPAAALMGTPFLMNCLQNGLYHLSRLAAIMGIELRKRRDF